MGYQAKKKRAAIHNAQLDANRERYKLAARLPRNLVVYPLPSLIELRRMVIEFESK